MRLTSTALTVKRTSFVTINSALVPLNLSPALGRNSADSTANRYGLTVRGSNPGEGEIFRTRPDRPLGQSNLLYNAYRVIPGGKAAGVWR